MDLVVDASAVLCAYLPDEFSPFARKLFEDYALGRVDLYAPGILMHELINACLVAKRRGRISEQLLDKLVEEIAALQVNRVEVETHSKEIFAAGRRFNLTAYDACYVVAAQMKGCTLITADRKMYDAVKHELSFVVTLEDYSS